MQIFRNLESSILSPALSSPFGKGNEAFGFSNQFKRVTAILSDIYFQALRSSLTEVLIENGAIIFAYPFTILSPRSNLS